MMMVGETRLLIFIIINFFSLQLSQQTTAHWIYTYLCELLFLTHPSQALWVCSLWTWRRIDDIRKQVHVCWMWWSTWEWLITLLFGQYSLWQKINKNDNKGKIFLKMWVAQTREPRGKHKIFICSSFKFILEQWSYLWFPNCGPMTPSPWWARWKELCWTGTSTKQRRGKT